MAIHRLVQKEKLHAKLLPFALSFIIIIFKAPGTSKTSHMTHPPVFYQKMSHKQADMACLAIEPLSTHGRHTCSNATEYLCNFAYLSAHFTFNWYLKEAGFPEINKCPPHTAPHPAHQFVRLYFFLSDQTKFCPR
jgi:hypothetical protein